MKKNGNYPVYVQKHLNWLKEIPANWSVNKLKHEYKFKTGFTPDTSKEIYYDEDGENWITITDITNGDIYDTKSKISQEAILKYNPNISKKGSLLYSFKLSLGTVHILEEDSYTNEAIATFEPNSNNYIGYLYYAAPIFIEKNCNWNIYGAKILNQELIKNAYILSPPLEEQIAITDYLNEKCGEIDELSSLIERQIKKLKEYRKSLIYEVVTGQKNA